MTAAFFTGCNDSPNGPAPVTSAEARADLESLASKVRFFTHQNPGGGDLDLGGFEKRAAAKTAAAAASRAGSVCEVGSIDIQDYLEPDAGGRVAAYLDTTVSYTSIVFNFTQEKLKEYVMNLALEKGYTVALREAPGANKAIIESHG
jgi:hypothetical protein